MYLNAVKMKKIFVIILVLFLCQHQARAQKNKLDKQGQRTGKWTTYLDSAKTLKSFEGRFRKGNPVGCLVVLRNTAMYNFLFKLLSEVLPNLKSFTGISLSKKLIGPSFSFTLKDLINFKELERQFYLFINLPPLNITLVTNAKTKQELLYLLSSFKLTLVTR